MLSVWSFRDRGTPKVIWTQPETLKTKGLLRLMIQEVPVNGLPTYRLVTAAVPDPLSGEMLQPFLLIVDGVLP